jgi:hypothetical protein
MKLSQDFNENKICYRNHSNILFYYHMGIQHRPIIKAMQISENAPYRE